MQSGTFLELPTSVLSLGSGFDAAVVVAVLAAVVVAVLAAVVVAVLAAAVVVVAPQVFAVALLMLPPEKKNVELFTEKLNNLGREG